MTHTKQNSVDCIGVGSSLIIIVQFFSAPDHMERQGMVVAEKTRVDLRRETSVLLCFGRLNDMANFLFLRISFAD